MPILTTSMLRLSEADSQMSWKIEYIKEALRDLKRLDPYNQRLILKAITKTAERPLPPQMEWVTAG
jgi:mRNA-degrading endonuclease RelE of RelBE toxin-antitoxin system